MNYDEFEDMYRCSKCERFYYPEELCLKNVPTAGYLGLKRRNKMVQRVYVAGSYGRNSKTGEKATIIEVLDNIRAGQAASLEILRYGYSVFCPWFDYQFHLLDDKPISVELYKENSIAWLEVSDAIVVISGIGFNSGVDAEILTAAELDIPMFAGVNSFIHRKRRE